MIIIIFCKDTHFILNTVTTNSKRRFIRKFVGYLGFIFFNYFLLINASSTQEHTLGRDIIHYVRTFRKKRIFIDVQIFIRPSVACGHNELCPYNGCIQFAINFKNNVIPSKKFADEPKRPHFALQKATFQALKGGLS